MAAHLKEVVRRYHTGRIAMLGTCFGRPCGQMESTAPFCTSQRGAVRGRNFGIAVSEPRTVAHMSLHVYMLGIICVPEFMHVSQ